MKQGDIVRIQNTNSELDGKLTTIHGLAINHPKTKIYIIRDPRINSEYSHMILTQNCLEPYETQIKDSSNKTFHIKASMDSDNGSM